MASWHFLTWHFLSENTYLSVLHTSSSKAPIKTEMSTQEKKILQFLRGSCGEPILEGSFQHHRVISVQTCFCQTYGWSLRRRDIYNWSLPLTVTRKAQPFHSSVPGHAKWPRVQSRGDASDASRRQSSSWPSMSWAAFDDAGRIRCRLCIIHHPLFLTYQHPTLYLTHPLKWTLFNWKQNFPKGQFPLHDFFGQNIATWSGTLGRSKVFMCFFSHVPPCTGYWMPPKNMSKFTNYQYVFKCENNSFIDYWLYGHIYGKLFVQLKRFNQPFNKDLNITIKWLSRKKGALKHSKRLKAHFLFGAKNGG